MLSGEILTLLDGLKIQGTSGKGAALGLAMKIERRGADIEKLQRKLLERKIDLGTELIKAMGEFS